MASEVIPLTTAQSVNICKKKSGAKVFRAIYFHPNDASYTADPTFFLQTIGFEKVNLLYGLEELKFYDGFEFNIEDLNKTEVERLVKERSSDKLVSLKMPLEKWHEVGKGISKYASKIHHVTLDVGVDKDGFVAFKKILQLYPNVTFSASNEEYESAMKSLVEKHSKKINRKVGYTIYRPNKQDAFITYTAGI
ncbi:hypothetical protein DSO57_1037735 [Entomophthora muscae]|nr:hypothetical protein DSO57_1037990 [Entomophthora muscae]KAJ9063748.1 hypothetical protein DSO57_1037735 [Entomophthora muscae]